MHKEIQDENDITKLTVPQVILLTLLATTVTSIATAIVVVQLVSGVPGQTVFQTIERVTETVVERPIDNQPSTTVIIKEGDLVAKAVAENSNSSEAIYLGDDSSEVLLLGHGFVFGGDMLISRAFAYDGVPVTAGLSSLGTYGSDKIMLWRITEEGQVFGKRSVNFSEGSPQVGQTVVYLGGDNSIVKGSISGVSNSYFEFSENLEAKDIGLMLDVGGDVIGLWTGSEILRSLAVETQITQLSQNPLQDFGPEIDNTQTNSDSISDDEKEAGCLLMGGTYNEYAECLGLDNGQCLSLGGEFNECASACRHNPDAEVCTMQCVVTCQL